MREGLVSFDKVLPDSGSATDPGSPYSATVGATIGSTVGCY
jgi:hypothetical protein